MAAVIIFGMVSAKEIRLSLAEPVPRMIPDGR